MKILLTAVCLLCAAQAFAQEAPEKNAQVRAELTRAAAGLEARVAAKPDDIELYMQLGYTYTRLGRADDAQRAFENAVRLDPKRAIAHYMLGLIYEKKGLRAQAAAAWRACLQNTADPGLRATALKHLNALGAQ